MVEVTKEKEIIAKLVNRVEELEDTVDFINAVKSAEGFIVYDNFVKKLKTEGRI